MMLVALRIGASGLRSSWASRARNSSLRRSASRRCSASSICFADGRFQLRGPLGDALLELAVQPLQLPRLAVELGEDPDLGAQQLRDDRDRDVVHRARTRSP